MYLFVYPVLLSQLEVSRSDIKRLLTRQFREMNILLKGQSIIDAMKLVLSVCM
jgi:hypothetical protein